MSETALVSTANTPLSIQRAVPCNPAETNATLSTATMAADQTTAEQKRLFTEAMVKKLDEQGDERSQFLTEARYEDICAALDGWTE